MAKETALNNTEATEIEEVLRKYDRESNTRLLKGPFVHITKYIAIAWSLFQLYTAVFGVLPSQLQRSIHLLFALALTYLVYPWRKKDYQKGLPVYDIVLAILGVLVGVYWVVEYNDLLYRFGSPNTADLIVELWRFYTDRSGPPGEWNSDFNNSDNISFIHIFRAVYTRSVSAQGIFNRTNNLPYVFYYRRYYWNYNGNYCDVCVFVSAIRAFWIKQVWASFFIDLANAIAGRNGRPC